MSYYIPKVPVFSELNRIPAGFSAINLHLHTHTLQFCSNSRKEDILMLKYIWLENEMKVTASDRTVVWTAYDYGKYRCSWEIHYNNRRSNTKCNMRQYKSENEITYYSLIHYILSTTQWTNTNFELNTMQ